MKQVKQSCAHKTVSLKEHKKITNDIIENDKLQTGNFRRYKGHGHLQQERLRQKAWDYSHTARQGRPEKCNQITRAQK